MIKMQVIGHLGQDATVNQVADKTVINFSVAHSENYTKDGVKYQKTTWVSCSYWTEKTLVAQYLKRGTQVYVEGQPDVKMYEDKNRTQQANIVLRVIQIQLLGSRDKPEGGSQNNGQQETNTGNSYKPIASDIPQDDDGLPF